MKKTRLRYIASLLIFSVLYIIAISRDSSSNKYESYIIGENVKFAEGRVFKNRSYKRYQTTLNTQMPEVKFSNVGSLRSSYDINAEGYKYVASLKSDKNSSYQILGSSNRSAASNVNFRSLQTLYVSGFNNSYVYKPKTSSNVTSFTTYSTVKLDDPFASVGLYNDALTRTDWGDFNDDPGSIARADWGGFNDDPGNVVPIGSVLPLLILGALYAMIKIFFKSPLI